VKVFEHGQSYKEIMPNIKRILMYSVSFIFIYYAYYACAKRNEDFSKVVFLNKDQASIPAIKLHGQPVMEIDSFYEGHLSVIEPYLIIKSKKQVGTYHVFDFKNLFYLKSFGSIGQGPGELQTSSTLIKSTEFLRPNCVWVYDVNSRQVKLFSLLNLFYDRRENLVIETRQIPDFAPPISNLFIDDSSFRGSLRDGNSRFFIYNFKNTRFQTIPYPDSVDSEVSFSSKGLMYHSTMIEHKGKFVNALWSFNVLEIYDKNFCKLVKIVGKQKHNLMKNMFNDEGHLNTSGNRYYIDLFVNDDFIFATQHNVKWNQLFQSDYSSKVLVFNWQGELQYQFELDHPIYSLAYDGHNGRILASVPYGDRSYYEYNTGKLRIH
jgi:hypothetical protein